MATLAVTPAQDAIVGEIFIAAPPARVFQALTDPAQVPRWWGQQDLYRITQWKGDLRVGGKWSSEGVGADGKTFRVEGEYLEVDPPRVLSHTWKSSYNPLHTVVRFELEAKEVHGLHPGGPKKAGVGTILRLRHEGFAGAPQEAHRHSEGWRRVLGWMQAFLEKGETAETRGAASARKD